MKQDHEMTVLSHDPIVLTRGEIGPVGVLVYHENSVQRLAQRFLEIFAL
jgi:hypothetical protein